MRQKDEDALQRKVLREKKKVERQLKKDGDARKKKEKKVLPRRKTNEDRNDDSEVEKLKEAEQKKCDNESGVKVPTATLLLIPGTLGERDLLLKALSDQGLKPEDIHYVLNGHIKQIGNLNLFSGAVHCVGYDICQHDQYLLHELKEGIYFIVKVIFSPPPFG
ncbi:metallo-beta-lactamase domain-containing protein 1 isoform X1 [Biomphalaria glabrata]|nr:metallo-beta-lactamase domain-containing protein 1 isoform X1 [Biomphalaria glabrata]